MGYRKERALQIIDYFPVGRNSKYSQQSMREQKNAHMFRAVVTVLYLDTLHSHRQAQHVHVRSRRRVHSRTARCIRQEDLLLFNMILRACASLRDLVAPSALPPQSDATSSHLLRSEGRAEAAAAAEDPPVASPVAAAPWYFARSSCSQ